MKSLFFGFFGKAFAWTASVFDGFFFLPWPLCHTIPFDLLVVQSSNACEDEYLLIYKTFQGKRAGELVTHFHLITL